MCRYVLIGLVLILIVLMAVAAVVVQEYGWTGFLIVVGSLLVLGYLAKKGLPRLFGYLLMRPMRQMGAALRGGHIVVHSVTPCERPEGYEDGPDPDEEEEAPQPIAGGGEEEDYEEPADEDAEDEEPAGPLRWYQIELTVTPPDFGPSEGRVVHRPGWSPALVGADGRPPGHRPSHPLAGWYGSDSYPFGDLLPSLVEVWDGDEYAPADDTVFGERRLRLRVGVARPVTSLTITYANFTPIGQVNLPRIDVPPEGRP